MEKEKKQGSVKSVKAMNWTKDQASIQKRMPTRENSQNIQIT